MRAIENSTQGKIARSTKAMERVVQGVHRVLNRKMDDSGVLTSQNRIWDAIQEAIMQAGFVIADVHTG